MITKYSRIENPEVKVTGDWVGNLLYGDRQILPLIKHSFTSN